jgi:hypothetical protein
MHVISYMHLCGSYNLVTAAHETKQWPRSCDHEQATSFKEKVNMKDKVQKSYKTTTIVSIFYIFMF